ncbi:hypothetical protein Mapa_006939 [Marchantia paleacea]|nr:hypothetical protein Mapa_006939 [Marchantia paleacea]
MRKGAALRVDQFRVGLESGLVEPGHGRPLGAVGRLLAGLLRRDGGRTALLPPSMHSHAHVRGQHDRRHQHQNAHSYGDPVPQSHSAHVRSESRRRVVGTHRRRSLPSSIISYPSRHTLIASTPVHLPLDPIPPRCLVLLPAP